MGEVLEGSYFLVSAPVKYGGIDGRRHGLCCWILRADSMKEQAVLRQAALEYLERDRPPPYGYAGTHPPGGQAEILKRGSRGSPDL